MSTGTSPQIPGPPAGFNPLSQEFIDDPPRWLAEARQAGPVFFAEDFGFYVLTRWEDVDAALGDWETFSNKGLANVPVPPEYEDRVPPGFFATGALISQDPPRHTGRRKLLNKGFTRGRMLDMEAPIEQICNDLIDGFIDQGHGDLMSLYCYEVSLRSILHLMGMPTNDLPRMRQLAFDQGAVVSATVKPMEHEEQLTVWGRMVQAREYLEKVAEERRQDPGDDLVSIMVSAADEDGKPVLTPGEAVTHLTELIFAGTDTTANLMGTMVRILDSHPEQLAELKAAPELWQPALEEGLRLRSATNNIFRIATRDVDIDGYTIPANSLVVLSIPGAQHDPERFPEPGSFDLHRENLADSVGFGKGRHFCMGAPLTRIEAPIGMRVLYERLPDLRVVPDQVFHYDPILAAVILEHLEVTW